MNAITTVGLTKHYGRRPLPVRLPFIGAPAPPIRALDSLDITVREGEIFGFLGPNGAGKSTTIRLLLGFLHPTAGAGRVLGLDIVHDSVAIRRRIGYLPGGIALYDALSGEELLAYLADLSGRPPIRRAELCERLGLSAGTLRRLVRDYSRGMRQKIGIVQALQHDPELAILDEPTEGLDPLMQRAFYQILDTLKAEGKTIFFSSHVLSEVERVCDRVAIIRRGRLVAMEDIAGLSRGTNATSTCASRGARASRRCGWRLEPRTARRPPVVPRRGDIRPFLAAIAGAPIADLTIEPAHLEEAFLEFYEDAAP